MSNLVELSNNDMNSITGGFGFFSEISKIFGRQGKPFIGRDVVEFVAGAVTAAATTAVAVTIPVPVPVARAMGKVAGAIAGKEVGKTY